ncbi:MAG: hypothetical protein NTV51_16020 [Verrucomicrobia bacterium]|nr:hypothetical protein [Verrucomicrobiota bacterium]
MSRFRPRVLVLSATFGLCLVSCGGRLAAQDVSHDKPVELPAYTVIDTRELPPPETWYYARIAGFEVLSNASEKSTKRLVGDFQRFYQALSLVWPGVQQKAAVPTALIICGRGQQFDLFVPAGEKPSERAMASRTLRQGEQSAIVIDFETKVLNLSTPEGMAAAGATAAALTEDSVSVGAGGDPGFAIDAYRQLYREYIRFLLSGVQPRGPAWFEEGVAQIFMAMEVTNTTIIVGKVEDPNTISMQQALLNDAGVSGTAPAEDRDFNAALAKRPLLAMEKLFAVTHDSPEATSPLGGTWAKQCYAFVHWCLYGDEGRHQKDFLTFLRRLDNEPLSEALFKDCFKKSYKDMLFTIRSYVEGTNYKVAGVRAGKGQKLPTPPPFELREATEAEVGRIKGDALRLAGNPAAARKAMTTPYIRGERDPQLLAAIGLLERASNDDVRARKLLEAAAQGKAARPRAYLELAQLRFAEAAAKPGAAGDRFSPEQTAAVLTPLFTARTQSPPLPEVYELIAKAWAKSVITPGGDHLAVLDEGVRLFPRNTDLVYATAVQKIRAGLVPEAASLISRGLKVAPNAEVRGKFETLKASLPAAK